MEQNKTDSELIDELLQNVKTLHEENARLHSKVRHLEKYTDDLVEHSNMPCLPADLRNLREANLALATENESLKKQNKKYSEALDAVSDFLEGF
jgi:FtsZ-binding cell division protein ZapB